MSFVDIREELSAFCERTGEEIVVNKTQIGELTQKNIDLVREREQALTVIKNIGKLLGE